MDLSMKPTSRPSYGKHNAKSIEQNIAFQLRWNAWTRNAFVSRIGPWGKTVKEGV
jgi:hypothetical protein